MSEIKNVAILGAGALGGYYASRFATAGFNTCLAATEDRGGRLRRDGLMVNGNPLQLPVVPPYTPFDSADLVIVALKHHQLAEALPLLRPMIAEKTLFLSVLNGLDSEAVIASYYGTQNVLLCIAVGIDAVRQNGRIVVANSGRLCFGEARNEPVSDKVISVQRALTQAGLSWETPVDMLRTLWWKFMINVGVNQTSAVLRAPYDVFQRSETARGLLRSLMLEVIELARAAGVALHGDDLDVWEQVLAQLDPQAKTSMLQDVEAGRKTEVEIFAGKVIELGEHYGISTPANRLMLDLLRVIEEFPPVPG